MNTIFSKAVWKKPPGKRMVIFYKINVLWMAFLIVFVTLALAAYGERDEGTMISTAVLGTGMYVMLSGGLLFMLKVLKIPRKD